MDKSADSIRSNDTKTVQERGISYQKCGFVSSHNRSRSEHTKNSKTTGRFNTKQDLNNRKALGRRVNCARHHFLNQTRNVSANVHITFASITTHKK